MARHVPASLRAGLVGIDVDPVNIEWCKTNMPFGTYLCVDPYAQTVLPNQTFDLIYSHSVMTHLNEEDQFIWLKELSRISRGIIILSVHGMFSSAKFPWTENNEWLYAYLERGFQPGKHQNPDIADVTKPGYYTDVAVTAKYIRERWSSFVDVHEIISGGFGILHDAVVCSPRGVAI
jgi:hypothetical protein